MPKNLYTRNGIFWARFKVKGIEYRESLRTRSRPVAEKRVKAVRQAVEDRAFFGAADPVSWKSAVVSWHAMGPAAYDIRQSTFDRYRTSIGQLELWLGDKDVQRIDLKLLKQIVIDRQLLGVTNATIRRDMTAVSSVLAHCIDKNWIEENPAKMIDRARFREKKAKIILPKPESLALVLFDESRFMDMARLARLTGMREEEIAGLSHDIINRDRMTATLEDTKSGRVREVTLTPEALAIVDRQPRNIRLGFVFWETDRDGIAKRFTNVAERWRNKVAGVARKAARGKVEFKPFRFHDLRHLFAVTYLRDRRGGIYELQQELGHASIATTEHYLDHLTPDEKQWAKSAVAQIGAPVQRFEEQE